MGHALNSAACPVPLDEIRVTTKSGRLIRDGEVYFHENRVPAPVTDPTKHLVDYSGAGAGASMEESLERLGIEGGAEIKAVNTWRVSNRAQYDAAMAAACQMVRPGTINMTVTIPEDE